MSATASYSPAYIKYMETILERNNIDIDKLTLANDRLFTRVMMRGDNAKLLVERVLGIPISEATVREHHRRFDAGPGSKWIEMDVVVRDGKNAAYDIEMQQVARDDIARRSRYYLSSLDVETSTEGMPYDRLPDIYSIFLCLEDPFGLGLRRYTCRVTCDECGAPLGDGTYRIFLNAEGTLGDENADVVALLALMNGHNDGENEFARHFANEADAVKRDQRERLTLMREECDRVLYGRIQHAADIMDHARALMETLGLGFDEALAALKVSEDDFDFSRRWIDDEEIYRLRAAGSPASGN